jgi:hypothetical protein
MHESDAIAVGGVVRRLVRPFDLRGLLSVPADRGRTVSAVVRRRPGAGGESVGFSLRFSERRGTLSPPLDRR